MFLFYSIVILLFTDIHDKGIAEVLGATVIVMAIMSFIIYCLCGEVTSCDVMSMTPRFGIIRLHTMECIEGREITDTFSNDGENTQGLQELINKMDNKK